MIVAPIGRTAHLVTIVASRIGPGWHSLGSNCRLFDAWAARLGIGAHQLRERRQRLMGASGQRDESLCRGWSLNCTFCMGPSDAGSHIVANAFRGEHKPANPPRPRALCPYRYRYPMNPIHSSYLPPLCICRREQPWNILCSISKQQSPSSSFSHLNRHSPSRPWHPSRCLKDPFPSLSSATQDAPTQPTPLPSRSPESQEAEACQPECIVRDNNLVCLKKQPATKNLLPLALPCLALPVLFCTQLVLHIARPPVT